MQGIKHALAYTKSSEVISSALTLLKILDSPQIIAQVLLIGESNHIFKILFLAKCEFSG